MHRAPRPTRARRRVLQGERPRRRPLRDARSSLVSRPRRPRSHHLKRTRARSRVQRASCRERRRALRARCHALKQRAVKHACREPARVKPAARCLCSVGDAADVVCGRRSPRLIENVFPLARRVDRHAHAPLDVDPPGALARGLVMRGIIVVVIGRRASSSPAPGFFPASSTRTRTAASAPPSRHVTSIVCPSAHTSTDRTFSSGPMSVVSRRRRKSKRTRAPPHSPSSSSSSPPPPTPPSSPRSSPSCGSPPPPRSLSGNTTYMSAGARALEAAQRAEPRDRYRQAQHAILGRRAYQSRWVPEARRRRRRRRRHRCRPCHRRRLCRLCRRVGPRSCRSCRRRPRRRPPRPSCGSPARGGCSEWRRQRRRAAARKTARCAARKRHREVDRVLDRRVIPRRDEVQQISIRIEAGRRVHEPAARHVVHRACDGAAAARAARARRRRGVRHREASSRGGGGAPTSHNRTTLVDSDFRTTYAKPAPARRPRELANAVLDFAVQPRTRSPSASSRIPAVRASGAIGAGGAPSSSRSSSESSISSSSSRWLTTATRAGAHGEAFSSTTSPSGLSYARPPSVEAGARARPADEVRARARARARRAARASRRGPTRGTRRARRSASRARRAAASAPAGGAPSRATSATSTSRPSLRYSASRTTGASCARSVAHSVGRAVARSCAARAAPTRRLPQRHLGARGRARRAGARAPPGGERTRRARSRRRAFAGAVCDRHERQRTREARRAPRPRARRRPRPARPARGRTRRRRSRRRAGTVCREMAREEGQVRAARGSSDAVHRETVTRRRVDGAHRSRRPLARAVGARDERRRLGDEVHAIAEPHRASPRWRGRGRAPAGLGASGTNRSARQIHSSPTRPPPYCRHGRASRVCRPSTHGASDVSQLPAPPASDESGPLASEMASAGPLFRGVTTPVRSPTTPTTKSDTSPGLRVAWHARREDDVRPVAPHGARIAEKRQAPTRGRRPRASRHVAAAAALPARIREQPPVGRKEGSSSCRRSSTAAGSASRHARRVLLDEPQVALASKDDAHTRVKASAACSSHRARSRG